MTHPAAASPLSRCRAAYADYQRACDELRLLDALPYRAGVMRERRAAIRDEERRRAYAVARMREACAEAFVSLNECDREWACRWFARYRRKLRAVA